MKFTRAQFLGSLTLLAGGITTGFLLRDSLRTQALPTEWPDYVYGNVDLVEKFCLPIMPPRHTLPHGAEVPVYFPLQMDQKLEDFLTSEGHDPKIKYAAVDQTRQIYAIPTEYPHLAQLIKRADSCQRNATNKIPLEKKIRNWVIARQATDLSSIPNRSAVITNGFYELTRLTLQPIQLAGNEEGKILLPHAQREMDPKVIISGEDKYRMLFSTDTLLDFGLYTAIINLNGQYAIMNLDGPEAREAGRNLAYFGTAATYILGFAEAHQQRSRNLFKRLQKEPAQLKGTYMYIQGVGLRNAYEAFLQDPVKFDDIVKAHIIKHNFPKQKSDFTQISASFELLVA